MSFLKQKPKEDTSRAAKLREERANILNKKSDFFIRESYNTLRTNVAFALTGENPSKVVAVTSAGPSEGKTITSVNLAVSLAEADKKVILIDCDLRRPKLNRLLNMSAKNGLSNLLLDVDRFAETIRPYRENIHVILSGSIPPNPSELLGSPRMKRLLEVLRQHYDYVILDTPPVNMVSDALVLAPVIDGALLVVRSNHTDRNGISAAVDQLNYVQAKILGFVINGVDMAKNGYGHGKYRYKRYGYGRYGYRKYGYQKLGYGGYGGYGYGGYGYGYGGYGYGYGYGQPRQPTEPEPAGTAENTTT